MCDFLGCRVPTVAFPHENGKGELVKVPLSETRYGRQRKREIQWPVFVFLSVVIANYSYYDYSCCHFAVLRTDCLNGWKPFRFLEYLDLENSEL